MVAKKDFGEINKEVSEGANKEKKTKKDMLRNLKRIWESDRYKNN